VTTFPGAPRTLSGGFIVMDAEGKTVVRTVPFQYNPDTLSRTVAPRAAKAESGDRLEALRLIGPPVETIKLEIELDATDRMEHPDQNPETIKNGITPELADLETIISPAVGDIQAANQKALTGTLEILPLPSPLLLLVLGTNRILPVRITDMSIVEEEFDTQLNPIRAKVSLGLRVLSSDDLVIGSKGAELFIVHAKRQQQLAARKPPNIQALGLKATP
jgi:hypothetical protein